MTLLEPDVFWSDIALGTVAAICGMLLARRHGAAALVFLLLAASTWIGAFYHGLINTTITPAGKILWLTTIIVLAASSMFLVKHATRIGSQPLIGIFIAYAVFASFVSEKFIWGLALQAVAILAYGYSLIKPKIAPRGSRLAFGMFFGITTCAIVVQQAKLTFGLPLSHNTLFHLLDIPAVILLYKSIVLSHAKKN